jgi:hypothetical protein
MTDISMRTYDNRYSDIDDRGSWVTGGTTLIAIGVGFTFLPEAPLYFVASIVIGIGVGLVASATIFIEGV